MDFPVRIACFLRTTVIFEIEVRFKFTQLYLSFGKSNVGDISMKSFVNIEFVDDLREERFQKPALEVDLKFNRVIQKPRKPRDEQSRGSSRPESTVGCLFPFSNFVSLLDLYKNNFEILNMVSRNFMPSKNFLLLCQKKKFSLFKMV